MVLIAYVIIFITFFNVIQSEINKCCPVGELLLKSNNTFECSSNLSDFVHPLRVEANVITGIPENCTEIEKCTDKTVDDQILDLYCDSSHKNSTMNLNIIHKCCPDLMFYNQTKKSCDFNSNASIDHIKDSNSKFYDLRIGAPNCSEVFVDYSLDVDSQFRITNGTLYTDQFSTSKFCIDVLSGEDQRTIAVLKVCEQKTNELCKRMSCVPKCCKHGHSYVLNKKLKKLECKPFWDHTFEPQFYDMENDSLRSAENLAVFPPLTCKERYLLGSSEYTLYSNGTLKLKEKQKYYEPHVGKYCIENLNISEVNLVGHRVLVCFPEQSDSNQTKFMFHFIGIVISIVALGATLIVYFFLPELQNLHGKIVICHVASMFAAYVFLACVKKTKTNFEDRICFVIGYGILFTFISAFSWLNVMCFDIWWTFGVMKVRDMKRNNNCKKFLLYCLYAFGLPLLITSITVFAYVSDIVPQQYKPKIGDKSCWLPTDDIAFIIYFSGPVGVLIICNIVLFTLTARHCLKTRADINRMRLKDSSKKRRFLTDKATLIMNLKLFMVMGITWLFEFISAHVKEPEILWNILDVSNMLQGLWIFFIFVFKHKVWKALKNKVGYNQLKPFGSQTQTTSASLNNSLEINTIRCTRNEVESRLL